MFFVIFIFINLGLCFEDKVVGIIDDKIILESQIRDIQKKFSLTKEDAFSFLCQQILLKKELQKKLNRKLSEDIEYQQIIQEFYRLFESEERLSLKEIQEIYQNLQYYYFIRYILTKDPQKIKEMLKSTGFEVVAKKESICPTKGKLLKVTYYDLIPELAKALEKIKENLIGPILTSQGYYIIYIERKQKIDEQERWKMTNQLVEQKQTIKIQNKIQETLERLKKEVYIKKWLN